MSRLPLVLSVLALTVAVLGATGGHRGPQGPSGPASTVPAGTVLLYPANLKCPAGTAYTNSLSVPSTFTASTYYLCTVR